MIKNVILRKLNLLFYIIRKEQTSLAELSERLEIPKRTVKEDLKRINELMEDEFLLTNFLVSSRHGVISIHPEYQQDAVKNAYALKLSLLKSQVIFNFCVLLITKVTISKDDLLNTLFISEAYLAKLTVQLSGFLKRYKIKILIDYDHYSLTGNELELRLFSYILLQDSYQSLEWPYKDVTKAQIRENIPEEIIKFFHTISNTKRNSLYLLHQLLRSRYEHQRFLNLKSDPAIEEVIELMVSHYDGAYVLHAGGYGEIPEAYYRQELLYFNFVQHIFTSDSIPYREKVELGRLYSQSDTYFCRFSNELFQAFLSVSKYPISEDSAHLYRYYLVSFNTLFALLGDRFETFLDLYIPRSAFHLDTTNDYISSIRQKMKSLIDDPRQAAYASSLLYALSTSEKQTKIKLYLQMNKDFIATYVIKNRLKALFNSENIFVTDDYSAADIVVTDSLEESTTEDILIFYFDSLNNDEAWEHLLNLIRKLYMKKCSKPLLDETAKS
ncbi:helix-turn-helix domain-containing protein [Enterococcus malodoratus]|uniref:helix-turn-helix domain-containing protein n=1 Tax=Enterococcus malodoratus TaxID=71451 RepID=UPI0015A58C8E|nr:helix-turn-helix domain-containing protein [Enterococcus malodoratus]